MIGDPRTILVSGAMGQIGKRVTGILLDRGAMVVALDLRTEATMSVASTLARQAGGSDRFAPVYVDLTDKDAVDALVAERRPDAIVHLAAVVSPVCYRDPELARRVNVLGTANLVSAARRLAVPPFFVQASSSAVYGSRNPYRNIGRLTPETPVNPVDCYGEQKVAAERIVSDSDLPHAVLRIGGIISPDGLGKTGPDYFLLMRATPRDNRLHAVDARDVALAFANAVERADQINGMILLIGGDESYVHTHTGIQDEVFAAIGLGRIGPTINLPGDPDDDGGWGLTDWFDTDVTQRLLQFQEHQWCDTLAWLAESLGHSRIALRIAGPLVRPVLRGYLALQRRRERRGPYADPWRLVRQTYGPQALARTSSDAA
jgi:nucleoside-diphosphate-sugar epimerase